VGLSHAYSRGITHRDVKLTNILISSTGAAKLVDFGLAQIYANVGREEDRVERTVDYAGLEKATNVKHGDVRSDIYFLGCVLYEMLTGRSPLAMTRDKHARMNPRRFSEVVPMRRDEVDAPPSVFSLVETMMSLVPNQRFQTPSQLLDRVKMVRRELEGPAAAAGPKRSGERSVFVVESDERLQERLRTKFKELGYRVLVSIDPVRAVDRFRQTPYDALVIDAGSVGEDGVHAFDRILNEAERQRVRCGGVLVLSEEQTGLRESVKVRPNATVLSRPDVTLRQILDKVQEMVEAPDPA
jgi:serine/threonine protein kinase